MILHLKIKGRIQAALTSHVAPTLEATAASMDGMDSVRDSATKAGKQCQRLRDNIWEAGMLRGTASILAPSACMLHEDMDSVRDCAPKARKQEVHHEHIVMGTANHYCLLDCCEFTTVL
eukprot:scaffold136228_cov22-Tisochrysis_lutea.AAC.1